MAASRGPGILARGWKYNRYAPSPIKYASSIAPRLLIEAAFSTSGRKDAILPFDSNGADVTLNEGEGYVRYSTIGEQWVNS